MKSYLLVASMLLASASGHAIAQETSAAIDTAAPNAEPVAETMPAKAILPANTELTITPNSELSSKSLKKGDVFTFATVYDVIMNDHIVIPKGTRGQGTVTWRTGKGAFGKSAKMELAFNWIDIGGRRIGVEGTHRQEGQGNTGATIGAVVAVGVFSAFVTGKSATVPHGMQLKAFTSEPLEYDLAGLKAAPATATIAPAANSSAVTQGTSPVVSASGTAGGAQ